MYWYIFSESQRRAPAPAFRLRTNRGTSFALDDNRGWGNLVLFFSHGPDCPHCAAAMRDFAARRNELAAHEAQIVPVVPAAVPDLEHLDYPFALLADPGGRVRDRYAALLGEENGEQVMLFVLDRFGAPYAGISLNEPDAPDLHEGIFEWLSFIGLQCPE